MFDVVLVAFGLERLVYRLSVAEYRDRFVLKGGMLVTLWTADTGRFTPGTDIRFSNPTESDAYGPFVNNNHRRRHRAGEDARQVANGRGACLPGHLAAASGTDRLRPARL